MNVHWFGGNDSLFGCRDKRCRISEAYSHLHSALFLRTTKIIYQYLVRKTRGEIVMQDARGTFQSESFYKMITFLFSLNERYLRTRYRVPCICGLEDCSIIRRHIFVNKSIPEQTKICLVYALGR